MFLPRESVSKEQLPQAWPSARALGQDGDLGGEGFHFLLPILFERPLEAGHYDRALGDFDQALFLESFVQDRDHTLPLGSFEGRSFEGSFEGQPSN